MRLHLADGRAIPVDHPEFLAYTGGAQGLCRHADDSFHVFDIPMIAGVEVTDGNGVKRDDASA